MLKVVMCLNILYYHFYFLCVSSAMVLFERRASTESASAKAGSFTRAPFSYVHHYLFIYH